MTVNRCTTLLVSGMLMKEGGERWIAEQPTLLGLYIKQHFPRLFQLTLNKLGPVRVQAWQAGKNLYDPDTWKSFRSGGKKD
jgi:hypothetical protein